MSDLTGCSVRQIDVADAADRRATLGLINRLYPHIPWTEDHFDWQFRQGPCGPANVRVIEADGRVVSIYAATRKLLSVERKEFPAWMVQDVMTDPDFRGRGFLNHLATLFMEDMVREGACGYTFPNKSSENSFRRSGWVEAMRVPIRVASTRNFESTAPVSVPSFEIEAGEIWSDAGLPIGVVRDRSYLNWRYGRPDTVYHRFVLGAGEGILVLKVFDDGAQKVVHICELFARAKVRSSIIKDGLKFVHFFATKHGAALVTCWLPSGHLDLAHYANSGFVRDMKNDRFVFAHGPSDVASLIRRSENWHITQGNSDVY